MSSLVGGQRAGWKCSMEFEVIHVSVFNSEDRLSPPLFIQTAKLRAATADRMTSGLENSSFACLLQPCLLILGGILKTFH